MAKHGEPMTTAELTAEVLAALDARTALVDLLSASSRSVNKSRNGLEEWDRFMDGLDKEDREKVTGSLRKLASLWVSEEVESLLFKSRDFNRGLTLWLVIENKDEWLKDWARESGCTRDDNECLSDEEVDFLQVAFCKVKPPIVVR